MSEGGRARARSRMLRRTGLIAVGLVLLALLLLASGHWILGIVVGAGAAIAVLAFLQLRTVH
ncbi:MAG: hypothetical protein ACXVQ3_05605 [Gaiellaceae bacterium]